MPRKVVPRVRWKVARAPCGGWRPFALLGEEPITLPIVADKALARRMARAKAKQLREAGQ